MCTKEHKKGDKRQKKVIVFLLVFIAVILLVVFFTYDKSTAACKVTTITTTTVERTSKTLLTTKVKTESQTKHPRTKTKNTKSTTVFQTTQLTTKTKSTKSKTVFKTKQSMTKTKTEKSKTVTQTKKPKTKKVIKKFKWNGEVLNTVNGTVDGPSGKETFYNLDMSGVISIMKNAGYHYKYWLRDDGVKMFGKYIMCAANLDLRPRGTILETSLGTGIVCDTGGFAGTNSTQLDIAVNW